MFDRSWWKLHSKDENKTSTNDMTKWLTFNLSIISDRGLSLTSSRQTWYQRMKLINHQCPTVYYSVKSLRASEWSNHLFWFLVQIQLLAPSTRGIRNPKKVLSIRIIHIVSFPIPCKFKPIKSVRRGQNHKQMISTILGYVQTNQLRWTWVINASWFHLWLVRNQTFLTGSVML